MLKAGRHFPHIKAGLTSEGNKDNACLGEVACFFSNLVGKLATDIMGGEIGMESENLPSSLGKGPENIN